MYVRLCLFKWVFWLRVFTFIYSFRSYAGLFAQVCSWLCLFANIRFAYHSSSYSILAKSEKTWIFINYFYSMFLNATSAIRRLVLFEGPKWSDRLSWSYSIIHDLLLELIWSNRFFLSARNDRFVWDRIELSNQFAWVFESLCCV